MIDDFTEENCGTRHVPGSHKLRDNPRPDGEYPTVPIIGKAGSVAFLHGYTWHKTGANVSRDAPRAFAYYVRPFLRVQENHIVSVREEVWHRVAAPAPSARRRFVGELDRLLRWPSRRDAQDGLSEAQVRRALLEHFRPSQNDGTEM